MSETSILDISDEQRLEKSLQAREAIVAELMEHQSVPRFKDDKILLIQALDGLDRTILARAKLKSDVNAQKDQKEITKMIAEVLMKTRTNNATVRTEPISLDDSIRVTDLVEGETEIGVIELSYDQFMGE